MRLKSLSLGQSQDRRRDLPQTGAREFLHGDDLDEVEHAQPSAEARGASSRQNMVGPGSVVPGGLRRIISEENRTCTDDARKILARGSEMFRRDPIGPVNRLAWKTRQQDRAMLSQRLPGNRIFAGQDTRLTARRIAPTSVIS